MNSFPRGFLRDPKVQELLQSWRRPVREVTPDEDRRIAESHQEIYVRAIRRFFDETEPMR